MFRKMSSLFHDREQQDGHECLRCILLCIQEATRAINQQRAAHCNITKPDCSNNNNNASANVEAISVADPVALHTESGFLKPTSPGSSSCPALHQFQSDLPDSVRPISLTAGSSTVPASGGSGSLHSPTLRVSEPSMAADGAKPSLSRTTAAAKKTPSTVKITAYFATAPPAPKTPSEITLSAAGKVADFVETLCEGKSERKTRCLECESVTRCTETFQDVEVVAQKAVHQTRPSNHDDSDSDCDDFGKKSLTSVFSFFLRMCLTFSSSIAALQA